MSSKTKNQITSSTQNVSTTDSISKVSSTSSVATSSGDSQNNGEGSMMQALQVVEKKIRNLEKRKVKLDGYRDDKEKGKVLNDDQNVAVSKYDEVIGNLEFARELTTQFKSMAIEEEKARKKLLKKELQERHLNEIRKIASTLEIQELVSLISTPKVYSGLSNGENGLPKLSKEEIDCLVEFERLIRLRRSDFETKNDFEKSLLTSAKHISFVINAEDKQFVNTTYKALYQILEKIRDSGYFERKSPYQAINPQELAHHSLSPSENPSEIPPAQPTGQEPIHKPKDSPKRVQINMPESSRVDSSTSNSDNMKQNEGKNVDFVGFGTFDNVEVQYKGAPKNTSRNYNPHIDKGIC